MSLSDGRKTPSISRDTVISRFDAPKIIQKVAEKFVDNKFSSLTFFVVMVTAVGLLFHAQFTIWWYVLAIELVALEYFIQWVVLTRPPANPKKLKE